MGNKTKIRKAKKEDLKSFIKLRKEYINIINKENKINEKIEDNKIIREFKSFFENNKIILLVEIDSTLVGFISGTIFKNVWRKGGYIDDIYIDKKFRRKGIATQLIKEFLNTLIKRKIKTCQLGVSKNNKKAINLYKKINFKLVHYEMGIKLK